MWGIWKKNYLKIRQQGKDWAFQTQILLEVLETEKVYVEISAVTSSWLNSLTGWSVLFL